MDDALTADPAGPAPPGAPDPAFAEQGYVAGVTPRFLGERRREAMLWAGIPEHLHEVMGPLGYSPLAAKMGVRFREMTVERMVATMPVAGNEQNAGLLHGGAHLVLAETLGSVSAVLHALERFGAPRPVVGIEISATHHRAIRSGLVTGTCTPVHLGGTLTTHEIVMTDEEGRRLSTAKITNMVLDPDRHGRRP